MAECHAVVDREAESVGLPSPWYGSCPMITTFRRSNGHLSKARNMLRPAGNIFCVAYSVRTKRVSWSKYGLSNSGCSRAFQSAAILTSM